MTFGIYAHMLPSMQQDAAALEQGGSVICGLGLVPEPMRQSRFTDGTGEVCAFIGPIPNSRPESVDRDVCSLHTPQGHQEHHVRERPVGCAAWKDVLPTT